MTRLPSRRRMPYLPLGMRYVFKIASSEDALALVAEITQRSQPGDHLIAAFDRRHRLQFVLPVDVRNQPLARFVELICQIAKPGEALLLCTNRTGEVPADRPTDETEWESMAASCRKAKVILLDWWIALDRFAFSIAEHATTPPGWHWWGFEVVIPAAAAGKSIPVGSIQPTFQLRTLNCVGRG